MFVALGCLGFILFKIGERVIVDQLLKKNGQITKAVIIDKKNYNGNDNVKPGFTYFYQFEIDKKKYTGNSHNKKVSIGDTIEIQYVKGFPCLNKALDPNE